MKTHNNSRKKTPAKRIVVNDVITNESDVSNTLQLTLPKKTKRGRGVSKQQKKDNSAFSLRKQAKSKNYHYNHKNPWQRAAETDCVTLILFNEEKIPHQLNQTKLKEFLLFNYATEINNHHSVRDISEYSANGSPLKVTSPRGTEYSKDLDLGFCTIFSSRQVQQIPMVVSIDDAHEFWHTDEYENVIPGPENGLKEQEVFITKADIAKTKRENRDNPSRSQNPIMRIEGVSTKDAISANDYAHASKLFEALKTLEKTLFEWSHSIGHYAFGKLTQQEANMKAATNHSNTVIMFLEWITRELSKVLPGVKWRTKSQLIPFTQIGIEEEIEIVVDNVVFTCTINLQDPNQPLLVIRDYIFIYFKAALNPALRNDNEAESNDVDTPVAGAESDSDDESEESIDRFLMGDMYPHAQQRTTLFYNRDALKKDYELLNQEEFKVERDLSEQLRVWLKISK